MKDPRRKPAGSSTSVHAIGALSCVTIMAAAAALFLIPTLKARAIARSQLAELAEISHRLDQVAQANRDLNALARQLRERVDSRGITLAPPQDLNRRLAELTSLTIEQGLVPEFIQPREPVQSRGARFQPIRYEVTGSPAGIYELLGRFDREHPDLHLESVTIEYTSPETIRLRTVLSWLTAPANP